MKLQVSICLLELNFNPLSPNLTKWSNTLKQFVGKLPTNCLNVFDHFVKLALKGLRQTFFQRFLIFFNSALFSMLCKTFILLTIAQCFRFYSKLLFFHNKLIKSRETKLASHKNLVRNKKLSLSIILRTFTSF